MMEHPAEGTLQAYLDGEIQSEPREALDRHLAGCGACRRSLAELDQLAGQTRRALALVDREPPSMEAARWEARRARATYRSRAHRRRLATAASVILLAGAGWVAAMPGSPIRNWWDSRSVAELSAPAEEQITGPEGIERAVVGVQLLDGRVSVSLDGVPRDSRIEVRLTDTEGVRVSAPAGSRFETGPGRMLVRIDGLEGDLTVELTAAAVLADVQVNDRLVLRKSGDEVSYPGPEPTRLQGGSVQFQAEGEP